MLVEVDLAADGPLLGPQAAAINESGTKSVNVTRLTPSIPGISSIDPARLPLRTRMAARLQGLLDVQPVGLGVAVEK